MTAPAYTRHFWAKSDRDNPQRIHLLEHHMADVGACLEALLAQPTIRRRLARSGGRDDLDAATIARLCVFAALHDIGKVNVGFQVRIWEPEDQPKGDRIPFAGHIADLSPVLYKRDIQTAKWFLKALQWNKIGSPAYAGIDLRASIPVENCTLWGREPRVSLIFRLQFSAHWRSDRQASGACMEGHISWCSRMP